MKLDARQRAMLGEFGLRFFEPPARPPVRLAGTSVAPVSIAARAVPATAGGRFGLINAVATENGPAAGQDAVAWAPGPAAIDDMPWDALAQAVAGCRACPLCATRRNTVFGTGDTGADWLIVGEAPGENEDLQGEPFVGQAGRLLDNMLRALGLDRAGKVYITNVLKCRPPANRNPAPAEVAQCEPFLRRQVALLQPRIILAMGRFAVQALLGTDEPIGKLRGRPHAYDGVPVVVTYHPAYLLRNLPEKAKAWADLCLALELMQGQAVSAPA